MQALSHRFDTIADAKAYALAGNATITLQSLKTQQHFTYKVKLAEVQPGSTRTPEPTWFVNLLCDGSADDGSFRYLGLVQNGQFRLTRASKAGLDAPSVKAFRFFLGLTELHQQLVVRHEGRCGRCGRTLTVPESIDRGIGPECASKMEE
jgi:Family of unknown function (DUF6011)